MTKEYKEIEIKFPLNSSKDFTVNQILKNGGELDVSEVQQDDIYYVPSHRNFLDEEIVSEWLRVRRTNKGATLNMKRWMPIGAKEQTHCDEFELEISDADAMLQIFHYLDFKEIVRVSKKRTTYKLNGVEIAIDSIEGLGDFIELEAKVLKDNVDAARVLLQKTLNSLSIDVAERDKRGYPYQLLGRNT